MCLEWLEGDFSVGKWEKNIKMEEIEGIHFWGKTDKELSLLCRAESMPKHVESREDSWKGFRITGTLDFSLIGILAKIAQCLAEQGISIFAVSTFDTDYIFLKKKNAPLAQKALEGGGWQFSSFQ